MHSTRILFLVAWLRKQLILTYFGLNLITDILQDDPSTHSHCAPLTATHIVHIVYHLHTLTFCTHSHSAPTNIVQHSHFVPTHILHPVAHTLHTSRISPNRLKSKFYVNQVETLFCNRQ